jgi:hypothetical protein
MITNVYKKHGARLINAHGTMLNNVKNVPKNTVIIFLSNPGYCTSLLLARSTYHDFFETRENLNKFLNGKVPNNRIYASNVKNRTHVTGDKYRDMSLTFFNKSYKGLAYVRKLPLSTQQHVLPHYWEFNRVPKFAETLGPIRRGTQTKLSEVIRNVGPGVYIVASCRRGLQNKERNLFPMNTPNNDELWPYHKGNHPTNASLRRKRNNLKAVHPCGFNYSLRGEREACNKYRKIPRKTTQELVPSVLAHMSKNGGKSSFRTYIGPLNANIATTKKHVTNNNERRFEFLEETHRLLSHKRELPLKIRVQMFLHPKQQAKIIYNYLARTHNARLSVL